LSRMGRKEKGPTQKKKRAFIEGKKQILIRAIGKLETKQKVDSDRKDSNTPPGERKKSQKENSKNH